MTTASAVFLGVIAAATVVMAGFQIGLVVFAVRLSKRLNVLSTRFEHEIGPIAERLANVAENLNHATSLASVQVERVDRLLSGATRRADETMSLVQGVVTAPIREGLAVIAALRGVFSAFRAIRGGVKTARQPSARPDDEDPLFIG